MKADSDIVTRLAGERLEANENAAGQIYLEPTKDVDGWVELYPPDGHEQYALRGVVRTRLSPPVSSDHYRDRMEDALADHQTDYLVPNTQDTDHPQRELPRLLYAVAPRADPDPDILQRTGEEIAAGMEAAYRAHYRYFWNLTSYSLEQLDQDGDLAPSVMKETADEDVEKRLQEINGQLNGQGLDALFD